MSWSKESRKEEWEGPLESWESTVKASLREGAAFQQSPAGGAREAMGVRREAPQPECEVGVGLAALVAAKMLMWLEWREGG